MATCIALLRGVNIAGNTLKMERLRSVCDELGFKNVRTYVQSGNVLFESAKSARACANLLEKSLVGVTRLPVTVLGRTPAELASVIDNNPFREVAEPGRSTRASSGPTPAKLYVAFLTAAPASKILSELTHFASKGDRFEMIGREIYVSYGEAISKSKLTNNIFERLLSVRSTMRNWNTVSALHELATSK